jgi:hypothetical protein
VELNSKAHFGSQFEAERMRLLKYKQEGLNKVRIAGSGRCPACINLIGKVLIIDEALKEMPIPVKDCTFKLHGIPGWCSCRYIPYLDDPECDLPDSFYENLKEKRLNELKR